MIFPNISLSVLLSIQLSKSVEPDILSFKNLICLDSIELLSLGTIISNLSLIKFLRTDNSCNLKNLSVSS
jgi:hypothetical protein